MAIPVEELETEGQPQEQPAFPMLGRQLALRGTGNPQAMVLRERGLADREYVDQQRFINNAQAHELSKVHALTEIAKERLKLATSMEMQRQKQQYIGELSKINPGAPNFEDKVLELGSKFPMAIADKDISKHLEFVRKTNLDQQAYTIGLQQKADEREQHTGVTMIYDPETGRPDFEAHAKAVATRNAEAQSGAVAAPLGADIKRMTIGPDGKTTITREQELAKPLPPTTIKTTIKPVDDLNKPFVTTETTSHVPAGQAAPADATAARKPLDELFK